MESIELYIEKAFNQAKYAYKKGNFPIGAILLVDDVTEVSGQNKVVTKKDPVYHAEIDIIHRASAHQGTPGKKLFVSMEPCGRCARALVEYGIDEVYYILKDPAWWWTDYLETSGVKVVQVSHLFTEYLDTMLEFLHKTHLFPEILPYYHALKRNINPSKTVWEEIPLTELLAQIHDKNKLLKQALGLESIKQYQYQPMLRKIADVSLLKYKSVFRKKSWDETIDIDAYYTYLDTVVHSLDELIGNSPLNIDNICLLHQRILSTVGSDEERLYAGKIRDIPIHTQAKNEDDIYHLRNNFISHYKVIKEFQKSIDQYNGAIESDGIVAIVDLFLACLVHIHVFRNGNGRLFYLLLDYLLFTHDYFPVFISQNKKSWDAIFDAFDQDRNKIRLRQNILRRILEIYSDYHIG